MPDPEQTSATLHTALAITASWVGTSTSNLEDHLDWSLAKYDGILSQFPLESIKALVQCGSDVVIHIAPDVWRAQVRAHASGAFTIENRPEIQLDEIVRVEDRLEDAQAALAEGDGERLLRACDMVPCRVEVTLRNDAQKTGVHWIRSRDGLRRRIEEDWFGLVQALFTPSTRRLVIHDGTPQETLRTIALVVQGSQAAGQLETGSGDAEDKEDTSRAYAAAWFGATRRSIPSPEWLWPIRGNGFADVAELFGGIAHGLVWLWLAGEVEEEEVEGGTPTRTLRFDGARRVKLDVGKCRRRRGAEDGLRLWRWAIASSDYVRWEAVQRAITLTVAREEDLEEAGEAVLSTAQYLHRIAQTGTIAEALAARRSVREAALESARAAGEAAVGAGRNVVDRVFAQLAGLIGVLAANLGDVLKADLARWLLVAVLFLTIVTAIVTFLFELPAARRTLEAFESDLAGHRDTLTAEDIVRIKNSPSIALARKQFGRATLMSALLLLSTAAVAGVAFWLIR